MKGMEPQRRNGNAQPNFVRGDQHDGRRRAPVRISRRRALDGAATTIATEQDSGRLRLPFGIAGEQPLAPVLLTERQVCQLLNIGRTTLRSLSLRPKHVNTSVRYRAADVERYIAELT
jgi:hypothetical protein